MKRALRLAVLGLATFLAFAWGTASLGCPVCFGESDAPIVKGVEMSVLFMVGITYSLMFSGVAAVIVLRRRVRQTNGAPEQPTNETSRNGSSSLE